MAKIHHQSDQWQASVKLKKAGDDEETSVIEPVYAHDMRTLAHRIANAVHQAIVGQPGHFEQRIVYRAECGPTSSGRKFRLSACDSDGENGAFLIPHDMQVRTLCSDVRSGRTAYSGCQGGHTRLFATHIKSGQKYEIPLMGKGIPIAPRFSPCGKNLIFSLAKNGSTSLYQYTFSDQKIRSCAEKGPFIDVSPSYSPDGQSFVFVSDRIGGRPRLYIKRQGQKSAPLSKGKGSYFSPSWSPDGQWIIFIKRRPDGYYLGIMAADGTQERLIARDHVIDSPSWSANSRIILFAAQQKSFAPFSLFTIDRSGRTLRKISLKLNGKKHGGSNPCWGASSSKKERN